MLSSKAAGLTTKHKLSDGLSEVMVGGVELMCGISKDCIRF